MEDYLIPASILALVAGCAAFIWWLSNYVGNASACHLMEAERARLGQKTCHKKGQ